MQCVPSPPWQTLVLYLKQLVVFLFQAVFCLPPPPPPAGGPGGPESMGVGGGGSGLGAAGTVGACGRLCWSHELQWMVGSRGFRRLCRQVPPSPLSPPRAGRGCHLGSVCPAPPPGPRGSRAIPVSTAAYPPTHGGTSCHGTITFGPWCEGHLVQYLFSCTIRCLAHPV